MQWRNLLVPGLLSIVWSASASSAALDVLRFDGRWGVVLVCPKAPDGALPWSITFTAGVTRGVLAGEHGTAGQPGWLSLDGSIQPDGAANVQARGLTGNSRYNVNQTAASVPYSRDVTAHFETSSATGYWRAYQSDGRYRTCDFTFTRQ